LLHSHYKVYIYIQRDNGTPGMTFPFFMVSWFLVSSSNVSSFFFTVSHRSRLPFSVYSNRICAIAVSESRGLFRGCSSGSSADQCKKCRHLRNR